MAHLSEHVSFDIKSTEAPHYRRVLIQKAVREQLPSFAKRESPVRVARSRQESAPSFLSDVVRTPMGVNDAKGFVFVSHTGEIYPSGFLPVSAGNVKKNSLVDVYRNSTLFTRLRDYSNLKGKCGACEYKAICGGSRARAFAVYGDMMAPEPFCVHVPKGYEISKEEMKFWEMEKLKS
jgi:radical SAM protein with 4Fe4S-binding SPASM domain